MRLPSAAQPSRTWRHQRPPRTCLRAGGDGGIRIRSLCPVGDSGLTGDTRAPGIPGGLAPHRGLVPPRRRAGPTVPWRHGSREPWCHGAGAGPRVDRIEATDGSERWRIPSTPPSPSCGRARRIESPGGPAFSWHRCLDSRRRSTVRWRAYKSLRTCRSAKIPSSGFGKSLPIADHTGKGSEYQTGFCDGQLHREPG